MTTFSVRWMLVTQALRRSAGKVFVTSSTATTDRAMSAPNMATSAIHAGTSCPAVATSRKTRKPYAKTRGTKNRHRERSSLTPTALRIATSRAVADDPPPSPSSRVAEEVTVRSRNAYIC